MGVVSIIGVWLLFEGATITFKVWQQRGLLFKGGDYSRAASDRGKVHSDVVMLGEFLCSALSDVLINWGWCSIHYPGMFHCCKHLYAIKFH